MNDRLVFSIFRLLGLSGIDPNRIGTAPNRSRNTRILKQVEQRPWCPLGTPSAL